MLVLDASAAVQYALAADGFGLLGRQVLVAPALLWSEVSSVLHELSWRRSLSPELAQEALGRFLGCRLLTLDTRLRRTASRVIDVVGPSDL